MLKLGGILKIHFLFDSGPIGVDGCAPKLQRFRDLARRTSVSNQLQHFQFTVGQTVNRTGDIPNPASGKAFQKGCRHPFRKIDFARQHAADGDDNLNQQPDVS